MKPEPDAIRHSFDGHGWSYIDRASGSGWVARGMAHADAEPLWTNATQHDWGPSTLGHGSQQCRRCLCTYEEALYALGMECKA